MNRSRNGCQVQIRSWIEQVMQEQQEKNLNGTLVINFLNQHIALAIGKICSLDRLEPEQFGSLTGREKRIREQ